MTSDDVILTIGIPTYQREESLKELLNKIAEFQPKDLCEILIINNGFFLDIEIIIKNLQNSGYIINIINNKKNCGGQENVLRIYENANGRYIWFLGDDDRLYEDSIQDVIDCIKINPCDCILLDSDDKSHQSVNLKAGYYEKETIWSGEIPLRKLMFAPLAILNRVAITDKAFTMSRLSLNCFTPQLLLIIYGEFNSFYYLRKKIIKCGTAKIELAQRLSILPIFIGIGSLLNLDVSQLIRRQLNKLLKSEWNFYLKPEGILLALSVAKYHGERIPLVSIIRAGFRNYPIWLAIIFSVPVMIIVTIPSKIFSKLLLIFNTYLRNRNINIEKKYSSDRI
jgi:glycosyltransferase involved in cell wall biosynthesis